MEARKVLKVDSCDLMHIRLQGKLRFKKERNAFLYSREDVQQIRGEKRNTNRRDGLTNKTFADLKRLD